MAAPKVQVPSPQIFGSDPVEQIYSRGVLDPNMSGLSYMLLNAAQDARGKSQEQYMQGVDQANQMASKLAQQEEGNKVLLAALGHAADLAKHGYAPAGMDVLKLGGVLNDNTSADANVPSGLWRALQQADIAEKNAKAAHAGDGAQDKYTVEADLGGTGLVTGSTFRAVGRDPIKLQAENNARIAEQQRRQKIGFGDIAPPSIAKAEKEARDAADRRARQHGQTPPRIQE